MTGLADADAARAADGGVGRDPRGRCIDARRAELEATGVDVGGRVAARAVAVEGPDRDVVARARDHGDVGEGSDGRAVTRETAGYALMRARHRVERVVARGGVALCTGGGGRDVVRGLGTTCDVAREGRCRRVTAAAVTRGRVVLVEGGRGT